MASFPQAPPPTPSAHLYPPPYAPHALPISFVCDVQKTLFPTDDFHFLSHRKNYNHLLAVNNNNDDIFYSSNLCKEHEIISNV
jgi:hypothetical protein